MKKLSIVCRNSEPHYAQVMTRRAELQSEGRLVNAAGYDVERYSVTIAAGVLNVTAMSRSSIASYTVESPLRVQRNTFKYYSTF